MIKLIIFDLDGVLIEAKKIHFDALNMSLASINNNFVISWDEHLKIYDGLKTLEKLKLLTKSKNLDPKFYDEIWKKKQEFTIEKLKNLSFDRNIYNCIASLKNQGYNLACCSNSIYQTIEISLKNLNILQFFDVIFSNEDVKSSKPHPEIFWKAMINFGHFPYETLIVEDSPAGLIAANLSGANILRVDSPKNIKIELFENYLNKINYKPITKPQWINKKMNVLIPMAGAGSRFSNAGYTFPKPLIQINNKPMIQIVIENLNIDANYIFIVQKSHRNQYNLDILLNLIKPNCKVIEVDGVTEGAACTALLAKEFINNKDQLFIANSDQFAEWNSNDFFYKMNENDTDGGILTFYSTHPKWSFAKINDFGYITEVAEKKPISTNATVGFYYWKHGSDFVKYAEKMIEKNLKVNNEFYICPVYNEAIIDNKKIMNFEVESLWGLGTPEDLDFFIKNYNEISKL